MDTLPQSPLPYTLTPKDLWRYQLYALTHFSMLSPHLKTMQILIGIAPLYCLVYAAYEFARLWAAARFAPCREIYSLVNEIDFIYIIAKDRYIIPKRAFATDSDAQDYYQSLYDWWQREALDPTGVWPPAPHSASESMP